MDEQQVKINFQCDKGKVAQSLRELADAIEKSNETTEFYETSTVCAEIDYDY